MRMYRELLFAALGVLPMQLSSTVLAAEFQAGQFSEDGFGSLNYRIYAPEDAVVARPLPMVVFLHGAGQRGGDNDSQLVHGARAIRAFIESHNQPAVIIAPQVPEGEQWVNTPWGDARHTMPTEPSRTMRLLIGLIRATIAQGGVDRDRVYITGLSMGGFGTWDAVARAPELFAAAIPICGGGDTARVEDFASVPIWAFHGDADQVVMVSRSRDMIDALITTGAKPRYTEYVGVEHDSWTQTYDDEVMQWLFAQSR